jgi:hypothetical protein
MDGNCQILLSRTKYIMKDACLLECDAVSLDDQFSTFQRILVPLYSVSLLGPECERSTSRLITQRNIQEVQHRCENLKYLGIRYYPLKAAESFPVT